MQKGTAMDTKVSGVPLPDLSPRSREKLLDLAAILTFNDGQTIFHEGDHALNLYIVKSGRVSIECHIPPRGTATIRTVGPGEWFSWSALIEPRIETASGKALDDCEIVAIRGGAVMDLCREDHEFGFQIYRTLAEVISQRLIETRLQMLDMYAAT